MLDGRTRAGRIALGGGRFSDAKLERRPELAFHAARKLGPRQARRRGGVAADFGRVEPRSHQERLVRQELERLLQERRGARKLTARPLAIGGQQPGVRGLRRGALVARHADFVGRFRVLE